MKKVVLFVCILIALIVVTVGVCFTTNPKANVVVSLTTMSQDDINKAGIKNSDISDDGIKKLTVRAGIRRTLFTKEITIEIPDLTSTLEGYYNFENTRTISAVANENLYVKNAYIEKYVIFDAKDLSNEKIKEIYQDSKVTVLQKDIFGRQYKKEQLIGDLILK